jgi:uncharacterized membrane protein
VTLLQRWLLRAAVVLAIAALTHLLVLWALPLVVMQRVLDGVAADPDHFRSGVMLPPRSDHTQRRIVLPSPDLLYALCRYDVTDRPLRVRASPASPASPAPAAPGGGYWSVALYAANTDNFYVLNDLQAAGRPADLVIVAPGSGPVNAAPTAAVVRSPSARGLVLMRVLIAGDGAAALEAAESARRTLRCEAG